MGASSTLLPNFCWYIWTLLIPVLLAAGLSWKGNQRTSKVAPGNWAIAASKFRFPIQQKGHTISLITLILIRRVVIFGAA